MAIERQPLESQVDRAMDIARVRPIDGPIDRSTDIGIRVPWLTQLGSLSIAQLYVLIGSTTCCLIALAVARR